MKLARFSVADLNHVPPDVLAMAKMVLMDTLGCMFGGSRTKVARCLEDVMTASGGTPQATVIGLGRRLSGIQAGYVNGQLADILDFEDTFVGHPGAAVIPAALAAAEIVNCSGLELLKAIIVGYEVCMRVALAVRPSQPAAHANAGVFYFHCFGATAAAGRLLRLEVGELEQAFGIAASHAPLPIWLAKWERPLHWVKNNFGGQTAAGLIGVLLAKTGFAGPRNILDHPLGFWRMVGSDRYDAEVVTRGLGDEFLILQDTFKPYPCCRWLHSTLDGVDYIVKTHRLERGVLASIVVRGPNHLLNFGDLTPQTLVDAQFSLPYSVAALLLGLQPGCEWFEDERLTDPEVRRLAELVKVIADPEMEDQYRTRGTYPVSVEVATRDGSRYQHRVDFAKGDPKNPMRPDELVSKFVQLAEPSLGKSQADQVLDAIAGLDREAEIQGFVNSLTPRALVA